jgi:glutathione S-transferase
MKLYNSGGPNPRMVRMFMAEKGFDVPKVDVDLRGGDTPEERARTRMWARRIDLNIAEPAANGFRFAEGLKMFENRVRCIPGAADGLKATARDKLKWLDGLVGSKPFIAGDKLTMADILLFAFLDFMANVGQPLDPDCKNLTAWFGRMKARPSAAA